MEITPVCHHYVTATTYTLFLKMKTAKEKTNGKSCSSTIPLEILKFENATFQNEKDPTSNTVKIGKVFSLYTSLWGIQPFQLNLLKLTPVQGSHFKHRQ